MSEKCEHKKVMTLLDVGFLTGKTYYKCEDCGMIFNELSQEVKPKNGVEIYYPTSTIPSATLHLSVKQAKEFLKPLFKTRLLLKVNTNTLITDIETVYYNDIIKVLPLVGGG